MHRRRSLWPTGSGVLFFLSRRSGITAVLSGSRRFLRPLWQLRRRLTLASSTTRQQRSDNQQAGSSRHMAVT
jgi:hypothetical protein